MWLASSDLLAWLGDLLAWQCDFLCPRLISQQFVCARTPGASINKITREQRKDISGKTSSRYCSSCHCAPWCDWTGRWWRCSGGFQTAFGGKLHWKKRSARLRQEIQLPRIRRKICIENSSQPTSCLNHWKYWKQWLFIVTMVPRRNKSEWNVTSYVYHHSQLSSK